jgi:elongator complex protein 4
VTNVWKFADKGSPPSSSSEDAAKAVVFCHDFDLSKRLALPSPTLLKCVPVATQRSLAFGATETSVDPFAGFLRHIIAQLATSSPTAIHRVVIPSILSPAMYPHTASTPEHILRFFQSIRALLRKHPTQLTVLITLPLSLYPRVNGLTRWMELLSDGVLEFAPFPSNSSPAAMLHSSGTATSRDEPPQGMLKVHRLPIFHEKGGGGGESSGVGDDLAFSLSRRKGLVIKPFSLPPVEGDAEAQEGVTTNNGEKATKLDIEF